MIKVGFNNYPLKSLHSARGIGTYTRSLLGALKKENDLEVVEFDSIKKLPNVDTVHYPWFDPFFKTLKLNKNIPTIVTIHDVIPLVFPKHFPVGIKGKINFYFQKKALEKVRFIITDSENSKKDIIKYLGLDKNKIRVVLLAPDPQFRKLNEDELNFVREKFNLPDNYILFVGDANYTKNLPLLIESFKELLTDKKLKDLKLVLVNNVFLKKDDMDHAELKSLKKVNELIQKYDIEKNILRMGKVESEDLVGIYNLAKVYVQPSLYEGFGIPILEAMACGVPVVSSNRSSLPEVGGDAVVYFNSESKSDLVSNLTDVLLNPNLQKKLSDKGTKRSKLFSWEKTASQVKNIYEESTKIS